MNRVQLLLDAARTDDWTAVTGNFGKLLSLILSSNFWRRLLSARPTLSSALSLISIAFDVVFIVQHYILYRDRGDENVQNAISKSMFPVEDASPSLVPVGLEAGEETPLLRQQVDTQ